MLSTPEIIDAEFRSLGIDVLAEKGDKISLNCDPDNEGYDKARSSGLLDRAKDIRAEYIAYLIINGAHPLSLTAKFEPMETEMSKTTNSASAIGLHGKEELERETSPCRVAQLAQDAIVVIDAHARADGKRAADSGDKRSIKFDMQMRVLNEKLDGIENSASIFPATSATGALFQLSLIKHMVDIIENWVPENSEHRDASDSARKAIDRMCYSIRDFIVSRTGTNPEDGCGDYYMSEKYNPHRLIAAAIAEKDAAEGFTVGG